MKINQLSDAYAASGVAAVKPDGKTAGTAGSGRPASTSTGSTRASGVSVRLSGSAEAMSIASGINDVYNLDKVQTVRADIESGNYRVNAEAIADKMLGEARYNLASHKRA